MYATFGPAIAACFHAPPVDDHIVVVSPARIATMGTSLSPPIAVTEPDRCVTTCSTQCSASVEVHSAGSPAASPPPMTNSPLTTARAPRSVDPKSKDDRLQVVPSREIQTSNGPPPLPPTVATIRSPIAATLSIADSPHGCGVDIQVEPSVDSHISLLKLCRSNRSNRELVGKKDWSERLPKPRSTDE